MKKTVLLLAVLLCAGSPLRAEPYGFPLTDAATGKKVPWSSFKDRMVLLEFWATYCEPCREVRPVLEKLQERFAGRSFTVLAVAGGEKAETVQKYLKAHPAKVRVLLDPSGKSQAALGVSGLPSLALIGFDGKLRWLAAGFGPSTEADLTWRVDREAPVSATVAPGERPFQ